MPTFIFNDSTLLIAAFFVYKKMDSLTIIGKKCLENNAQSDGCFNHNHRQIRKG